jgi:hypothetical protein
VGAPVDVGFLQEYIQYYQQSLVRNIITSQPYINPSFLFNCEPEPMVFIVIIITAGTILCVLGIKHFPRPSRA